MKTSTDSGKAGGMTPLGSVREVVTYLSSYNTSPDGSGASGMGENVGIGFMYGPGFIVEVPVATEEVNQLMVTITDEDFAWAVLMRMCRQLQWKMMDPESGRTFG